MRVDSGYDARMTVEIELLSARLRNRLLGAGVFLGDDELSSLTSELLDDSIGIAVAWVEGRREPAAVEPGP